MYAIKSNLKTAFRRDGVTFPAHQWLLIAEPTERQITEPTLIILEGVESLEDPRLAPQGVINPEELALTIEPEPVVAPKKGK